MLEGMPFYPPEVLEEPKENESVKDSKDNLEALPNYVQETVAKTESESKQNYEAFVNSEHLRTDVRFSVKDTAELKVLLRYKPELEDQIKDLIPDYEDFTRGVPPEDADLFTLATRLDTESAKREYRKEKARKELIEDVFRFMNVLRIGEDDYVRKEQFDQEVKQEAGEMADELIKQAKLAAENFSEEGHTIMVSVKPPGLMGLLKSGEYRARLDVTEFSQNAWDEISKALSVEKESPSYKNRFDRAGTGKIQARYVREIELGIYKPGEDRHPVYAEMVVDQGKELGRMQERGYGNIHLLLRSTTIENRTVFATNDTVAYVGKNHQMSWSYATKARAFLNALEAEKYVDWQHLPAYVEAHIMGGVRLEDFEGCILYTGEENSHIVDYFEANPDKFEVKATGGNTVRAEFLQ